MTSYSERYMNPMRAAFLDGEMQGNGSADPICRYDGEEAKCFWNGYRRGEEDAAMMRRAGVME